MTKYLAGILFKIAALATNWSNLCNKWTLPRATSICKHRSMKSNLAIVAMHFKKTAQEEIQIRGNKCSLVTVVQ